MEPIEIPPGVTTLLSRAKRTSNWRETNLVRWENGTTLSPVGGWSEIDYGPTPFASRCRKIHRWMTLNGLMYTAYLCEGHVYVDESDGVLRDITPVGGMNVDLVYTAGYGEKEYGAYTYGTARPGESNFPPISQAYSLSNWGEDLLAMTSQDGRLLRWKPSTPATLLEAVPNFPAPARQFVVTNERHCMAFGINGNFGDFGWCDEADLEDWTFADPLNKAGMFTVEPLSPIVAAQLSDVGITVHTPIMTHIVQYIGVPYIYRIKPIGRVPIPISAQSTAAIPLGIIWVSIEGFWLYNGVNIDVVFCSVWDTVLERANMGVNVKECSCVTLLNRGEFWWFWVDKNLGSRNSRYIALDYRAKIWMTGYLNRDCGYVYGNERVPIMSDGAKAYQHEVGLSYPGAIQLPFMETHVLNADGGAIHVTLNKLMAEVSGDNSPLRFSVAKSTKRADYTEEKYTPKRRVNEHGYVDIRETGRDLRLRIDVVEESKDWGSIGPFLMDLKARGAR